MLRLTCLAVFPALSLANYVVPLPNGPYGVSIQDVLITDYSLPDPYSNLTYRRVPTSIISSTGSSANCTPVLQPYMPSQVAAVYEKEFSKDYGLLLNETLTQTSLMLCKPMTQNISVPVVILAAGAGVSRYLYNILGLSITAQTGYTVITYDTPGQTDIVVFPNGTIEYATAFDVAATDTNDHAVAEDLQSAIIVLNTIFPNSTGNITTQPSFPPSLLNTSKAAMIGHSQGGAASLVGLLADPRLRGAANMDGGLNITADNIAVCSASNSNTTLSCNSTTTNKPFMIVEHQGFNQSDTDGWAATWQNVVKGTKYQVQLNGSQHGTFGDYPYIIDLYGTRVRTGANATLVNEAVGSIPGTEVMEILSKLFASFLGYVFADGVAVGEEKYNVTEAVAGLNGFGLYVVNQTVVD